MIVISSFRQFGEDPEWDANQLRAYRSWMMFAERIYLFNKPESILKNSKVQFIDCEEFPRIKDMVALASKQHRRIVMICNGDICVDPNIKRIEVKLMVSHACCASSRRWHFTPTEGGGIGEASLMDKDGRDDRGRDVFIARANIWGRIAMEIPDKYRIGHGRWDAFMTDIFRQHWNDRFVDFTSSRLIFHPIHEGRRRPYDLEIAST